MTSLVPITISPIILRDIDGVNQTLIYVTKFFAKVGNFGIERAFYSNFNQIVLSY